MSEDARDHPDYEAGYYDSWHDRGVKNTSQPYLAGFAAARNARKLFEEAGFTRRRGGIYRKTLLP